MSKISVILEPDDEGTLHLPLPPELRDGKVKVEARLERVMGPDENAARPNGTVLDALREMRALGGMRDLIPDPISWQREQRIERPLPDRE